MNQILSDLKKSARRNDLLWRYLFNLRTTLSYSPGGDENGDGIENKIIEDLNRDGFAKTTIDELFPSSGLAERLDVAKNELVEAWEERISELAKTADDAEQVGKKTYSIEMLGGKVKLDPESLFSELALSETFIKVANRYFGMVTKLRYFNVWYTIPTSVTARESQLWHFDREDNLILKVFIYLKDVDEGAGPFTYAPGTHRKGRHRDLAPERFNENGVLRSTDEQMAAVYPREKWIRATGKAGTVIFADTRGLHKGGEARTDERVLFTTMYTSSASQSKKLLEIPADADLSGLSRLQRNALR